MTDQIPGKDTALRGQIIRITGESRATGCLAIIDEIKPWGVIAYVQLPPQSTETALVHMVDTMRAYLRLKFDEFKYTGGFIKSEEE